MKKLLVVLLTLSLVVGMFSFAAFADQGNNSGNGNANSTANRIANIEKDKNNEDNQGDRAKKPMIPAYELSLNSENALLNKEASLDHSAGNSDANADKVHKSYLRLIKPASLFQDLNNRRSEAQIRWDTINHLNSDIKKAFGKFRNSLKVFSKEEADKRMIVMKATLTTYHTAIATVHTNIKNIRVLKGDQWKLFRAAIRDHHHLNRDGALTALTEITRLKGEIVNQLNSLIILKTNMLNAINETVPVSNIIVTAENFNTNKSTDYYGVSVGYTLTGTDLSKVASVTVALYSGQAKIVENVTKSAEKAIANPNGNFKYSSAFIVKAGSYTTSSTWNFGTWAPSRNAKPTRAVITIRDIYGSTYTAENNTLSEATATWDSLFASDIVVVAENFNTNKGADYNGATFGYRLSGTEVAKVASVKVALFSTTTLLAENTSKSADKVNVAQQYSCAFIVLEGTYKATNSSTWNFGVWSPSKTVKPTKAVVTVTDVNGFTYTAENAVFLDSAPSHDTWESLFP